MIIKREFVPFWKLKLDDKEAGEIFDKAFDESFSDYVDKEHVYFINGDKDFVKEKMLYGYGGGIHCVCTEIPE